MLVCGVGARPHSGGEGSRLVAEAWRALRCETSSGPLALVSIAPVIVGSISPTGVSLALVCDCV